MRRLRPRRKLSLQFFREVHFIEAPSTWAGLSRRRGLQFFRELHFIEAPAVASGALTIVGLQFFLELHFIEAPIRRSRSNPMVGCSSFESCTSLRLFAGFKGLDPGGCSSFESCTSLRRVGCDQGNRRRPSCSSFESCTSLRPREEAAAAKKAVVAVLSRGALH